MERLVLAAIAGLVLAAVWATLKGLRVASSCSAFCAAMLGLVVVLERGAAAASLRAAEAADLGVAAALSSWQDRDAPPSSRVLTFFVADAVDGDDDSGAGPSWMDALRGAAGALLHGSASAGGLGLEAPGAAIDWRTETLAWASDRDAQYDALSRALAVAKKAGARVQIVARGRGADTVLAGLRRGGALPDRMLIVGRAPGSGDEKLASDVAFVYATPGGAEAAFTGPGGSFARVPGSSVAALVSGIGGAIARDAPFRAAAAESSTQPIAPAISTTIGGMIKSWAP